MHIDFTNDFQSLYGHCAYAVSSMLIAQRVYCTQGNLHSTFVQLDHLTYSILPSETFSVDQNNIKYYQKIKYLQKNAK